MGSCHSYGADTFTLTKRCYDVRARIAAQIRRVYSTKANKQVTQTAKHILQIESKEEKQS